MTDRHRQTDRQWWTSVDIMHARSLDALSWRPISSCICGTASRVPPHIPPDIANMDG